MLAAYEFAVGTLADAQPGTLVLPRSRYESTFFVGDRGGQPFAMFLDGDHQFGSFASAAAENWNGLLIPNVELIVDPASLFDPDDQRAPLGAVVRSGSDLAFVAKSDEQYSHHSTIRISVRNDLPKSSSALKAGFLHWHLVLGSGLDQRELFKMDLRTPEREKS